MVSTAAIAYFSLMLITAILTSSAQTDACGLKRISESVSGFVNDNYSEKCSRLATFICQHLAFHKYMNRLVDDEETRQVMNETRDSLVQLWVSFLITHLFCLLLIS